jgi:hypothetical protein
LKKYWIHTQNLFHSPSRTWPPIQSSFQCNSTSTVAFPLLQWHFNFYSGKWLILYCISTVAYHFYRGTPLLQWHCG